MDWIQILRLIVILWPIIEKLLNLESDEAKRNAKANAVTSAMAKTLSATTPPRDAIAVIAPIAEALV